MNYLFLYLFSLLLSRLLVRIFGNSSQSPISLFDERLGKLLEIANIIDW